LAIWNLRQTWDRKLSVLQRMEVIRQWYSAFGGVGAVLASLEKSFLSADRRQHWKAEGVFQEAYEPKDEISF
jgi:hypothetical protein